MESISDQALISAATQNLGITILPEALVKKRLAKGTLRKINVSDYEFARNSYIIFHKDKTFTSIKKEVFNFSYKSYKNVKN